MHVNRELLGKVIAAPELDAPRLAYADWAEREGDVQRAEFIRLQCQLARMSPADPTYAEMRERELDLLVQFAGLWAVDLGSISEWEFHRGFIESVEMCLETSRDEIVRVLQQAPIKRVRDISQFCNLQGVVDALPDLAGLEGLEFWGLYGFDNELLDTILQSPHLGNLRTLILHHDRNGGLAEDDVIIRGLLSPHRRHVAELAVNVDGMCGGPSVPILQALAASPYLRNLKKLNLSNIGIPGSVTPVDLDTIRALAASPNLANLHSLDLGDASLSLEVWDEVLRAPWLPKLQHLRLEKIRQIIPPDILTIAYVADLPDYRAAFDRAGPQIDWETQFVTPWDGNASWQGFSWGQMKDEHLFSMWPQIQQKDYARLESRFHADCVQLTGAESAQSVAELSFAEYEQQLAAAWKQARDRASQLPQATAIYLRLSKIRGWQGMFHIGDSKLETNFRPRNEISHDIPIADVPAPRLEAAAELRKASLVKQRRLDPGGVEHYLLARTIAALGRVVQRDPAPLPVFFSCVDALFRL